MKPLNLSKNILVLSTLILGGFAQAHPWQEGRGGGRGGYNGPDCRYNDPRCEERRGGGPYRDPRDERDPWGDRRGDRRGERWGHHDHHGRPDPYYPPAQPPYQPPYPPSYPQPPQPPPYNPPPSRAESSIIFNSLLRRPGGEWLRVNLHSPVRLDFVQVQVMSGAVVVHEAALVTRSGYRYLVRDLSQTGLLYSVRTSENLNIPDQVVAIEMRAEAMGDFTNLLVRVIGSNPVALSGNRF